MNDKHSQEMMFDIFKETFEHPKCKKVFDNHGCSMTKNLLWNEVWGVINDVTMDQNDIVKTSKQFISVCS
jgi:hypothetical protein